MTCMPGNASADVAYLDRRKEAHILDFMYENKEHEDFLDTGNINTRSRAIPLFKRLYQAVKITKKRAL